MFKYFVNRCLVALFERKSWLLVTVGLTIGYSLIAYTFDKLHIVKVAIETPG